MIAVASEYHTSENVKIERRPSRSAMKPNPTQPTHIPAKVQKTKNPTPCGSKNPAGVLVKSPPDTSPGVMYAVMKRSYSSKMPPSEISSTNRHSVRENGRRSRRAATSAAYRLEAAALTTLLSIEAPIKRPSIAGRLGCARLCALSRPAIEGSFLVSTPRVRPKYQTPHPS